MHCAARRRRTAHVYVVPIWCPQFLGFGPRRCRPLSTSARRCQRRTGGSRVFCADDRVSGCPICIRQGSLGVQCAYTPANFALCRHKRDSRVTVSFEATFAGERRSVRTDIGPGSVPSASCRVFCIVRRCSLARDYSCAMCVRVADNLGHLAFSIEALHLRYLSKWSTSSKFTFTVCDLSSDSRC